MKKLLTPGEVAALLGLHVGTVYTYAAAGKIPSIKLGSHVRFAEEAVEEWIKKKTKGAIA